MVINKSEQFTEDLTKNEMGISLGKNNFGYVFPQGVVKKVPKIYSLLEEAGGKPKECELNEYPEKTKGRGKPEYIITFNEYQNTILVVECKRYVSRQSTETYNKPNSYAVDGALYYAKFLKKEYNVIAVAISGTNPSKYVCDAFYWRKGGDSPEELKRLKDIILDPVNYLNFIRDKKISKKYSLEEIRELALTLHGKLREVKMPEAKKPLFIAGILIALQGETFSNEYPSYTTFDSVIYNLKKSIKDVLNSGDIRKENIDNIVNEFNIIGANDKLKKIPLGHDNSITWYIEQLELKIKPMMTAADSTLDSLGVFYHEFVKYSGGDGKLGIVLTPQHLTEFMAEIAGINRNSKVVDIACGSGSFLVTAMTEMFKDAGSPTELKNIRENNLYGIEEQADLYVLSIANMIVRKDGKSNIINGDCFDKEIIEEIKKLNINIGLLNPPFSQDDHSELEFVEQLLECLIIGGTGVVIAPMSSATGTKFKEERKRLFKKHTLKAVFSMPEDVFYPQKSTNVCVMVWEAHKPHDINTSTFFGYYKDDGFVKRKQLGRIDFYNKWEDIKKEWIRLYKEREVIPGLSAKHTITDTDEWLCEAYMKTDYTKLTQTDFQQTVNDYLAYLVKNGEVNESK